MAVIWIGICIGLVSGCALMAFVYGTSSESRIAYKEHHLIDLSEYSLEDAEAIRIIVDSYQKAD